MAHNKKSSFKKNKLNIFIISVIVCLLILLIATIYIKRTNTNLRSDIQTTSSYDGSILYITPTVLPSDNQNRLLFRHPLQHFSFEYPREWNVILTKRNIKEDWYEAYLTDKNNAFRIHFMNDYRGLPYFDYDKIENKIIGNLNTKWRTMYRDQKAFEISVMIKDESNIFYPHLFGLYIYLPEENQEELIKKVEEIIASLKKT